MESSLAVFVFSQLFFLFQTNVILLKWILSIILGIHDLARNTAVMYIWNESIASQGPEGSCLMHYCKNYVSDMKLIMIGVGVRIEI